MKARQLAASLVVVCGGFAVLTPDRALAQDSPAASAEEVRQLRQQVQDLKTVVLHMQEQLARLTAASKEASSSALPPAAANVPAPMAAPAPSFPVTQSSAPAAAVAPTPADPLHGITINALIDGYYEYNLNSPLGRINELRSYDVSSNSFSLNQADLIVESAPDVAAGKRYGLRLDLQYGQATSTLQGNATNELRPDIYRNVFQAYGTYVFPLAHGLTVDFGKWASSLGLEGNYTKDQLNYSRSFWFDYLPFYHAGLRTKLAVNDAIAVNLWITNGTNQTEAFNNYKDQMLGILVTPTQRLSWTLNYYRGQEHPDVVYLSSAPAGATNLPVLQGTYVMPIPNAPNGLLQIVDSYLTWEATKALTLAAEADYVQERLYSYSSPARVEGGALYVGYQLTPAIALAARGEYMADVGGLFSGETQFLKETTVDIDYRFDDGFLVRAEYRRDQSNQHYFLSHSLGVFEAAQPTIGVGLVWWFGEKQGTW